MAHRSSSTNSGNSATPSANVPSGVAAGDIVHILCTIDNPSAAFDSGDWPSGFAEHAEVGLTLDGHRVWLGWKRASGADSGTYDFGNVGASGDWICHAVAHSGRHASNPPVASTVATNNSANTSPINVTANGVTALDGDDLLWGSAPDVTSSGAGNGHTAPTNFTERQDTENAWSNLSIATRDNVSAGATGSITGVFALSQDTAGYAAILVRIPAAAAGTQTINVGGSITPTGGLTKQVQKLFGGSVTPSGALAKQIQKLLGGSITATGALIKLAAKLFGGSITPAGALTVIRTVLIALSGSITPSGAVTKQAQKLFAGSVSPSGALSKLVAKLFGGSVTPTSALAVIRTVLIALGGSITPSGSLRKQVNKLLGGSITPVGSVLKHISKFFSGLITPSGTVSTPPPLNLTDIRVTVGGIRLITRTTINHAPITRVKLSDALVTRVTLDESGG